MKNNETMFMQDLRNHEQGTINRGYYNLIISVKDVTLFELGLKPHRNWKISDVKTYFGVKGTTLQIKDQLKQMLETIKNNN